LKIKGSVIGRRMGEGVEETKVSKGRRRGKNRDRRDRCNQKMLKTKLAREAQSLKVKRRGLLRKRGTKVKDGSGQEK